MRELRTPPVFRRRLPYWPADRSRRRAAIMACAVVVVGLLLWFLLHRPEGGKRGKLTPVTVARVTRADVPLQLRSIGNVTPINSVAVKAHVAGQILQTHFVEGQTVTAGQLLFTIDPRPLQAAFNQAGADVANKEALVAQASAAIAKDEALLVQAQANRQRDIAVSNNAANEAQRYLGLAQQGAVSREQFEQYRTNLLSARATVAADQAAIGNVQAAIKADRANLKSAQAQLQASQAVLQNARVQLGYASVTAPISGKAGNIQVLSGNIVRADQDTLVTINQISPIYVSLNVPEQRFNMVRAYASGGAVGAEAFQANGSNAASEGRLVFANNTVDPATGTVLLKALFGNGQQRLWPGEFVNVVLTLAVSHDAVVVPDQSVQEGQTGQFVWVVNADKTAHMQPVTTAQSVNGITVITSGLQPGQLVVTDGQLQLSEGARVTLSPIKGL